MKLGIENRKEVLAAIVLGILAVLGMWHWHSFATGSTAPPTSPVTASPSKKAVKPSSATGKDVALDPTLHFELLKNSEGSEYDSGRRNIFSAGSSMASIEQPVCNGTIKDCKAQAHADCRKNPKDPACAPPPPPGPNCSATPNDPQCPPPAIALKFFGFASSPGGAKKVFLAEGEDVFIGAQGDIVDRHYRIVKISPDSVEVEDVLNNVKQTLPLSQS